MKVLVVIDCQNDFIDGVLGTNEALAIIPNVKKKIEEYRRRGDKIIFTRDTHQNDYLNTNEGKHLPVKHCIEGTDGWDISDELDVHSEDFIFNKPTFGSLRWKDFGFNGDIELVGLCTDICVVSNALILKAQYPEIKITVDSSCCAGVTPESHQAALTTMKMCQIEVI